jgi:hypothetical protein
LWRRDPTVTVSRLPSLTEARARLRNLQSLRTYARHTDTTIMATDATDPKDAVNAAAEMTAARLVTASRQTAQFTDLPVELKERIYSYAIATDGHHTPMNSFRTNTSSSFCYAN